MEFTLSGNALKTLARSIACLSRVGNDLAIQASPSQLSFHALNSSRSAYQLITFKPDLFDVFTVSGAQVQCSVLLKVLARFALNSVQSRNLRALQAIAECVKLLVEDLRQKSLNLDCD